MLFPRPLARAAETMSLLLTLSTLFLTTLASADSRHIGLENVCSSSPLLQSQCLRSVVGDSNGLAQARLRPLTPNSSEPSPWISEAECIETDDGTSYCVYTSPTFANGRGISILTTPDRAETVQRLPAFTDAEAMAGANSEPAPPFEERVLPGRGRGLIANKTLHRGDRIFAYSPILVLDEDAFDNLDQKDWIAMETAAVEKLPLATRQSFWELHGEPSVNAISDRIDTNAFEIEIGDSTQYIVVPEIAVSALA